MSQPAPITEVVPAQPLQVPPPAGVRGDHVRCGCGASWFGKNAGASYRRHWLTKHAPQPVNPPHEEES